MSYFYKAIFFLLLSSFAHAGIYKWIDANGKMQFSDKKPDAIAVKEVILKINTYTSVTFEKFTLEKSKNAVSLKQGKVIIYSAVWCGYCDKAKAYFKKKKIRYTEYDVEKSAKGKRDYKKLKASGVPVILVGDKRMNGFSQSGFDRMYF